MATGDKTTRQHQMQRLAIAAGVTLKDGSQVILDGPKTPSTARIIEKLRDLGWMVQRMTRDQRSDAIDDHGYTGRHFVAQEVCFPDDVAAILKEPVGFRDVDGEMSVEDWLLASL